MERTLLANMNFEVSIELLAIRIIRYINKLIQEYYFDKIPKFEYSRDGITYHITDNMLIKTMYVFNINDMKFDIKISYILISNKQFYKKWRDIIKNLSFSKTMPTDLVSFNVNITAFIIPKIYALDGLYDSLGKQIYSVEFKIKHSIKIKNINAIIDNEYQELSNFIDLTTSRIQLPSYFILNNNHNLYKTPIFINNINYTRKDSNIIINTQKI